MNMSTNNIHRTKAIFSRSSKIFLFSLYLLDSRFHRYSSKRLKTRGGHISFSNHRDILAMRARLVISYNKNSNTQCHTRNMTMWLALHQNKDIVVVVVVAVHSSSSSNSGSSSFFRQRGKES